MTAPAITGPQLIGEFIAIPAWQTEGCVIASRPARQGSEAAIDVLVERWPDDPRPRWYRLEPDEYTVTS
jgi:hypothetical protein